MFTRGIWNFPSYGMRTQVEELDRMKRYLDQLFRQADQSRVTKGVGVFPLVNLTETQEAYFLRAELPGVSAENLDIQTMGRNITISGERRIESEREAKYHRRERESGRFSRAVALPGEINRDKIEATLKNGVLELKVPKSEAAKPKKIDIK
jgi:HSP20 family protein